MTAEDHDADKKQGFASYYMASIFVCMNLLLWAFSSTLLCRISLLKYLQLFCVNSTTNLSMHIIVATSYSHSEHSQQELPTIHTIIHAWCTTKPSYPNWTYYNLHHVLITPLFLITTSALWGSGFWYMSYHI